MHLHLLITHTKNHTNLLYVKYSIHALGIPAEETSLGLNRISYAHLSGCTFLGYRPLRWCNTTIHVLLQNNNKRYFIFKNS